MYTEMIKNHTLIICVLVPISQGMGRGMGYVKRVSQRHKLKIKWWCFIGRYGDVKDNVCVCVS